VDGRSANVRSEVIADLEAGLARFSDAALQRIKTAEGDIRRLMDQVEDRRREVRREIESLRNEISEADDDDDDTSTAERRLEEAEEMLGNIRRWQGKLEAAVQNYTRESRRLEELSTGKTADARTYLRSLLSDLAAYFALQKDGFGHSGAAATPVGRSSGSTETAADTEAFDPTQYALPSGYHWVRIAQIDTARELIGVQNETAYEKVPYAEMRRGLDAMRSEILPTFAADACVAPETFARRDAETGTPYEAGVQRVFEAFFGSDPIYLSSKPGSELASVTSGRHRIKAAIDAGWTAVPVKMSGATNR
jgi:hypothetical protein